MANTFSSNINFLCDFMAKTAAYLRVSTADQDLKKNKHEILDFANNNNLGQVIFYEEKISGRTSWKNRKISEVIENLSNGDHLIVNELSRLGRSMLECMEILSICLEREINIYAIKGNWRLDNSLQSKIVAMAFSMASEIERELISSRTKEALKARKKAGQTLGRPKGPGKSKLDQFKPEIEALLNNGSTQRFIANRYNVTPSTLNNWIKKHKILITEAI